jgi:hypothetical protein
MCHRGGKEGQLAAGKLFPSPRPTSERPTLAEGRDHPELLQQAQQVAVLP